MGPISIISQSLAAGGLTGARPALTLFLLQLYAAITLNPALPDGFGWILHEYCIAAMGAVAIVEHFIRTDPEFEEVMEIPNRLAGVATALMASILLVSMGEDPTVWKTVADASLIHSAGLTDALLGVVGVAIVLAAMASLVVAWLRRWTIEMLDMMGVPDRWLRWTETGGVVGAVALLVFLPFLALLVAVLVFAVSGGAALTVWLMQRSRDAMSRHACPNPECDYKVRDEAMTCPECGERFQPETSLSPEAAG